MNKRSFRERLAEMHTRAVDDCGQLVESYQEHVDRLNETFEVFQALLNVTDDETCKKVSRAVLLEKEARAEMQEEASERWRKRLSEIRYLYRDGTRERELWGIPHEMEEGQAPADFMEKTAEGSREPEGWQLLDDERGGCKWMSDANQREITVEWLGSLRRVPEEPNVCWPVEPKVKAKQTGKKKR